MDRDNTLNLDSNVAMETWPSEAQNNLGQGNFNSSIMPCPTGGWEGPSLGRPPDTKLGKGHPSALDPSSVDSCENEEEGAQMEVETMAAKQRPVDDVMVEAPTMT